MTAGLYCDYLVQNEQTTSNMLGDMLSSWWGGGLSQKTYGKHSKNAKDHFAGVDPEGPELLQMLWSVIAERPRVVICIDGLDESPQFIGQASLGLCELLFRGRRMSGYSCPEGLLA